MTSPTSSSRNALGEDLGTARVGCARSFQLRIRIRMSMEPPRFSRPTTMEIMNNVPELTSSTATRRRPAWPMSPAFRLDDRRPGDERSSTRPRTPDTGQRIVEIGSHRGRSTIVLARAARAASRSSRSTRSPARNVPPTRCRRIERSATTTSPTFHGEPRTQPVSPIAFTHLAQMSDDALTTVEGAVDLLYIDGGARVPPGAQRHTSWGDRVRPWRHDVRP